MKKLILLLTVLICSCSSDDENNALNGEWHLVEIESLADTIEPEYSVTNPMWTDDPVILFSNNTFTDRFGTTDIEGTYTFEYGILTMNYDGFSRVYHVDYYGNTMDLTNKDNGTTYNIIRLER